MIIQVPADGAAGAVESRKMEWTSRPFDTGTRRVMLMSLQPMHAANVMTSGPVLRARHFRIHSASDTKLKARAGKPARGFGMSPGV